MKARTQADVQYEHLARIVCRFACSACTSPRYLHVTSVTALPRMLHPIVKPPYTTPWHRIPFACTAKDVVSGLLHDDMPAQPVLDCHSASAHVSCMRTATSIPGGSTRTHWSCNKLQLPLGVPSQLLPPHSWDWLHKGAPPHPILQCCGPARHLPACKVYMSVWRTMNISIITANTMGPPVCLQGWQQCGLDMPRLHQILWALLTCHFAMLDPSPSILLPRTR